MKKLLKYIIPIFLLLSALVGFYVFNIPTPKRVESPLPKKVIKEVVVVEKVALKKEHIAPIAVVPQKFKDVAYVMQIDDSATLDVTEELKQKRNKPKKEKPKKSLETRKTKPKKSSFEVTAKKYDNLKQMQEMYKKEKKYSLALKIGQQYYKKKNYSKSLQWSKEANILDHKAEGAWILYAKSEYAKGNKKRAMKLLNLYLGNTQSLEVESLLTSWIKEKK